MFCLVLLAEGGGSHRATRGPKKACFERSCAFRQAFFKTRFLLSVFGSDRHLRARSYNIWKFFRSDFFFVHLQTRFSPEGRGCCNPPRRASFPIQPREGQINWPFLRPLTSAGAKLSKSMRPNRNPGNTMETAILIWPLRLGQFGAGRN